MAADSNSNYLATLLRRGASPFHAPSAASATRTHASDAPIGHASAAETSPTTFASTFELSLEETAEFRHEARLDPDASSQPRPDGRFAPDDPRTESQPGAPHRVGNAEHDAAPSRLTQRSARGRAPEHVSQQATETPPAPGSFTPQTTTETARQFSLTAQTSASQETALKESSLTSKRAEQLGADSLARVERLEKSVARLDSVRLTDFAESNEAQRASVEGQPAVTPQPAERTQTVARGKNANANLQAEQTAAQAPPMNFTAQANAAFTAERDREADLQHAANVAAQSKTGTLTIKRLEVQLINQTPAPPPAPQPNARPPLARTTRTNSLHRHHLGRFSWGL